jgi:hypothetical protein
MFCALLDNVMESTKTFVFNNTEVKLTGRTADKELKATRRSTGPNITTLYEITPVDQLNGSWKKWVRMAEMFEIKGE